MAGGAYCPGGLVLIPEWCQPKGRAGHDKVKVSKGRRETRAIPLSYTTRTTDLLARMEDELTSLIRGPVAMGWAVCDVHTIVVG